MSANKTASYVVSVVSLIAGLLLILEGFRAAFNGQYIWLSLSLGGALLIALDENIGVWRDQS